MALQDYYDTMFYDDNIWKWGKLYTSVDLMVLVKQPWQEKQEKAYQVLKLFQLIRLENQELVNLKIALTSSYSLVIRSMSHSPYTEHLVYSRS